MDQQEYTLSIIKPDAMNQGIADKINEQLRKAGLDIVAQRKLRLSRHQAEEFYAEHKASPFYNSLVEFMTSGEVIVQVLAGVGAIALNRSVMGATNPKAAAPGTIRNLYGTSVEHNCVHGSDSLKSAKREIGLFFNVEDYYK
jgi:nucleoside-diphosphate kinase